MGDRGNPHPVSVVITVGYSEPERGSKLGSFSRNSLRMSYVPISRLDAICCDEFLSKSLILMVGTGDTPWYHKQSSGWYKLATGDRFD